MAKVILWLTLGTASAGGMVDAAELIGKVVDVTGGPLHNTTVELRRESNSAVIRTFFTDRSGVFRFTDLAAGIYQLSFECPGFHAKTLSRTVSSEETLALPDVVLQLGEIERCPDPDLGPPEILSSESDGGTVLAGSVSEQGYTPVREAIVILTNGSGSYRTSSGTAGTFQFSDIKPGVYSLRVQHRGFAEFVIDSVEIKDGHTTSISDTLLLPRCPATVKCQPVRNTPRVRVCL